MTTLGELCCEVCRVKGSVTPMLRANPKGEPGRWRCTTCLDKPIDPTTAALLETIQEDGLAGLLGTGVRVIDMEAPLDPR